MNGLVPGTGLVFLGREWLGLACAAAFGLFGETAAWGLVLASESLPEALSMTALALAALIWMAAQVLLFLRIRFLRDPRLPLELAALRKTAEKAMALQDAETAWHALRVALAMEPADAASRVSWARLLTMVGDHRRARRAWRNAARLDRRGQFATQIQQGIRQLAETPR